MSQPLDLRAKAPRRPLDSSLAERAAQAARDYAAQRGSTVSVAVVDESGNLVYFSRGNDCAFVSYETARGKAVLAAGFRQPTHTLMSESAGRAAFWASVSEKLGIVIAAGGYPLTQDGYIIGGVGCGGAHGDVDQLSAEAAANAVNT